jgi:hypothetical protein
VNKCIINITSPLLGDWWAAVRGTIFSHFFDIKVGAFYFFASFTVVVGDWTITCWYNWTQQQHHHNAIIKS